MAKLEYFLVAESVVVDQTTNRTSIFNVLEEMHADNLPSAIAELSIVSLWRGESNDAGQDFQVKTMIDLNQVHIFEFATNFKFETTSKRHRIIQRISGLPVKDFGDLTFELTINGQHAATHVVTISKPPAGLLVGGPTSH